MPIVLKKPVTPATPTAKAYPIEDLNDYKFWSAQNRKPATLLREIRFRWRGCSARKNGFAGTWAAHPHQVWRNWMWGVPERTFERWLEKLEAFGLIERVPGHFNGNIVHAFLRPSEKALKFIGKAGDLERLRGASNPSNGGIGGGTDGGMSGGIDGGIGGGTDHTSFPSYPSSPSVHPFQAKKKAPVTTGGKGKVSEEITKETEYVLNEKKGHYLKKEKGAPLKANELELVPEMQGLLETKETNLLKKYPKLSGPHEKKVKHPSELYPNWISFSDEAKAKLQAKYEGYIKNVLAAKGGKGKAVSSMTEEELDNWTLEFDDDEPDFETVMSMTKAQKVEWEEKKKAKQQSTLDQQFETMKAAAKAG